MFLFAAVCVASNAMAVDPLKGAGGAGGSSSWFSGMGDSMGSFFNGDTPQFITDSTGKQALNPDYLSTGDIAGGIGSLVTGGLGAYGMFQGLDMAQEKVDQGWASVNLQKDAFAEEKRRHDAGAERNKKA